MSAMASMAQLRALTDTLLKASFSALSASVFYGTSVAIGRHIFTLTLHEIGEGLKVNVTPNLVLLREPVID
jgi:hypothetical protein